jgi:hypothetical protein
LPIEIDELRCEVREIIGRHGGKSGNRYIQIETSRGDLNCKINLGSVVIPQSCMDCYVVHAHMGWLVDCKLILRIRGVECDKAW